MTWDPQTGDYGVLDIRELAWAAGLFEGEGCFTSRGPGPNRPAARLSMADEGTVRRFHAAVGVGNVYGPYKAAPSSLGTKPYWQWAAQSFEDFQAVAALLWYGLGPRRKARAIQLLEGVSHG